MRHPLVLGEGVGLRPGGAHHDVVGRSTTVRTLGCGQVRHDEQDRPQALGHLGGLLPQVSLVLAQGAGPGLVVGGLVTPAFAVQPSHLLGQGLHLVAHLVGPGRQHPVLFVEHPGFLERSEVDAPTGQGRAELVGMGAQHANVEHAGTLPDPHPGRQNRLHLEELGPARGPRYRRAVAPAVVVDELTIRYGERVAVDAVSFEASSGSVVALLGPNGAGKTSTIETLEGYRRPSHGRVAVLGRDPAGQPRDLVARMGVMLQEGGVGPAMRPREVLGLHAAYHRDPEDPDELIDRLGLRAVDRTPWRHLSGGERQRLSLGLALVGRPEVAFLDEPTAGVDVQGRQVIREVLGELRDRGVCVVLATHELDEAERVADRAVVIDGGRLVADATVAGLTEGSGNLRFGAEQGLDTRAIAAVLGWAVTEEAPGRYRVAGPGDTEVVARLTGWLADQGVRLGDLRTGRSLEDAFVELTTEQRQP